MAKNVGLTYGEFSFPSEQGFTGSAGKESVKGYQRGGRVRKMAEGGKFGKPGDKYPKLKSGPAGKRSAMPKNVKMKGGKVNAQMGGYMGPEREIAVDDVKITVPKMKGGSVHDKLKHEGAKMGYAYGGQVKDTSGEFVEKRGKQDTMDHGVQPAQKGNNEAEVEAGGNKRLTAGYKKGGKAKKAKGSISEAERKYMEQLESRINAKGTSAAKRRELIQKLQDYMGTAKKAKGGAVHSVRMPRNVKAKGGLAKYAHGGYAAGDKKSHPTGRGRTPYKGYNEQPGGSGNEDARYMKATGGAVKKAGAAQ